MKKKIEKSNIYIIYSILFVLISIIAFIIFFKNNCSFIWNADGLKQHYIFLKDFNELIRGLFANPSNGIDLFSWNMGLGLDVIGQYSYYVIGDPFAYISLLFPMKHLDIAYTFLVLLRMYCIGIAFMIYAKYHGKCKSRYNILIGAIVYTFSSFTLFAGVRHPYFLNAMILLPLLLTGVDRLLRENKKIPLTVFVAISAISNYYFFYMHTIVIVIYAVITYFCEYRKEGAMHFFKKLGSAVICYIIGILIASIILLPTAYAFINSARSGEDTICQYNIEYYKSVFGINLLTSYGDNWSFIGVSSIILLMLPILWVRRKEHKVYFIYLIATAIMLVIPFLGSMMNGFSYPNNRWSFTVSFILAYIITTCFDKNYSKKELRYMAIFLILYSIFACIIALDSSVKPKFVVYIIQVVVAFFMLLTIWYQNFEGIKFLPKLKIDKFKTIILILIIGNIFVMSYGLYSSYDRNYAKQFIKFGKVEKELNTQLGGNPSYFKNIQKVLQNDSEFYRIAKIPHQIQNLSIYHGYPSTECFLSIGSKYVYELNRELADNLYTTTYNIRGIGDRTKITTLLGTKYYITDKKNEKSIPYGYSLKEQNGDVNTYKNNYPLSIGVSYDKYMLKEDYEKLNPIEKEDTFLKVAVIENEIDLKGINVDKKVDLQDIHNCYKQIPYNIIDEEEIVKENKIVTKKKKQSIFLDIGDVQNSELYVYISGFNFEGTEKHTVTAKFKDKTVGKMIEDKITSAYYQRAPEIVFNLGYYDNVSGKIKLNFSTKGTYKFDSIKVVAVPMNSYVQNVQKLQKSEMKDLRVTNKEIKGNVSLLKPSIIQIATSYTTGWKAYVDGKSVDTINVNTAFIGIPVSEGEHEITLKYEVPYLKIGIMGTAIGIVLFVLLAIVEKRKK